MDDYEKFRQSLTEGSADEADDEAITEDDKIRNNLIKEHHDYHFWVEDPSDSMTDDQLWEQMPKPWRDR
jgi:SOS-response transcriptional repressor LexA